MGIRILPPAEGKSSDVGDITSTGARSKLELCDTGLNNIFNECHYNPLPLWKMEELKTLDYWGFIDYLSYCMPNSTIRSISAQGSPPPPPLKAESATESLEDSGASLLLSQKQSSRRWKAAKSTPVVPSPVLQ